MPVRGRHRRATSGKVSHTSRNLVPSTPVFAAQPGRRDERGTITPRQSQCRRVRSRPSTRTDAHVEPAVPTLSMPRLQDPLCPGQPRRIHAVSRRTARPRPLRLISVFAFEASAAVIPSTAREGRRSPCVTSPYASGSTLRCESHAPSGRAIFPPSQDALAFPIARPRNKNWTTLSAWRCRRVLPWRSGTVRCISW